MSRTIAVTDANIITCAGDEPIEGGVVVIEDGRFVAVGSADEVDVPAGAEVIDAAGRTVMPGLIEGHAHIGGDARSQQRLRATLQRGITTVCSVSANLNGIALREGIAEGYVRGCARLVAGCVVTPTFGHVRFRDADGPWEVRKAVREMVQAGADFIKTAASGGFQWADEAMTFRNYTPEELTALVDEAHAWGRRVSVHAHAQPGINNSIAAGCDSIHHCALMDDEGLERLAESGLWFVPTLHVTSEKFYGRPGLPGHMRPRMEHAEPIHREGVRRAHELGIPIAVGTDGAAGDAMHEMMELVACGLTPMEAIVAGTRNAADCLGLLDETGTLEPGKRADLIAVRADPLADISVLYDEANLALVMRNGLKAVPRQAEL